MNQSETDLGIVNESQLLGFGISRLIELGAEGEMIASGPILCPGRNNFFVPLMEQQF